MSIRSCNEEREQKVYKGKRLSIVYRRPERNKPWKGPSESVVVAAAPTPAIDKRLTGRFGHHERLNNQLLGQHRPGTHRAVDTNSSPGRGSGHLCAQQTPSGKRSSEPSFARHNRRAGTEQEHSKLQQVEALLTFKETLEISIFQICVNFPIGDLDNSLAIPGSRALDLRLSLGIDTGSVSGPEPGNPTGELLLLPCTRISGKLHQE
ncbi:uncharacterized protein LOC133368771 [Rhineura floridana]|uniref:uncharacterized protein LOC133368771 n=1 Tax=Rhineura floridana TaxID=261503 RepID=UPI002AC82E2B|nr:uncharacterized protein LOC133368771 [Rhineura floridana]